MSPGPQKRQSLAVTAYETMVRKIICLDYQPGQHLEEVRLMEDLNIGRTPIREALVRLSLERMVESLPNKGVVVRPITLQNTKAMFESMAVIELAIVDIALKKDCTACLEKMEAANRKAEKAAQANDVFLLVAANHDFHMHFARSCQNEFLIRAAKDIRTEAKRLSYLSYSNIILPDHPLARHYQSVIQEHDEMIASIRARAEDRLKSLIRDHIQTFRERIITFMTH